jgi:hypothetical protein
MELLLALAQRRQQQQGQAVACIMIWELVAKVCGLSNTQYDAKCGRYNKKYPILQLPGEFPFLPSERN